MEKALGMILRTGNCATVISGMDSAFIKVRKKSSRVWLIGIQKKGIFGYLAFKLEYHLLNSSK